jgi:predicted phosphodiesterase
MLYHAVALPQDIEAAYIVPLADLHIGDPLFDEQRCQRLVRWIAETPNAWAVLVGDVMNTATKTSKSDIYQEVMNPHEQLRYAKKLLAPIKDKIIAAVEGNHELRIAREDGINTTELLADTLGVFYSPLSTLMKITLGRCPKNGKRLCYTMYVTHGSGSSRTSGGKVNALRRLRDIVLADVYVMGHIHWMATFLETYYVPDVRNNKIEEVRLTFVSTGSFLKWGGYAEEKSLPPAKLGAPRIRLDGTRKDVRVSL